MCNKVVNTQSSDYLYTFNYADMSEQQSVASFCRNKSTIAIFLHRLPIQHNYHFARHFN
jgi:hypothetical protein